MTFFATYFRWKWEMIFFLLSSSSIVEREKTEIIRWWLKNCQAPLNELLIRSSRKSEKKKIEMSHRMIMMWLRCEVHRKSRTTTTTTKIVHIWLSWPIFIEPNAYEQVLWKTRRKKTDIFISDILSRSSFSSFEAKTEAFYPKHFSLFFFSSFYPINGDSKVRMERGTFE